MAGIEWSTHINAARDDALVLSTRNNSLKFADRTRKNLQYIGNALENGADVHDITQIVNSMLGLVVFPWEAKFDNQLKDISLDELEEKGWPHWEVTKGNCVTLGQLVRRLRNGVSHRHLHFSSDSRDADEVMIEVWDQGSKNSSKNWEAHISAADLRIFCLKFTKLLEDTIG